MHGMYLDLGPDAVAGDRALFEGIVVQADWPLPPPVVVGICSQKKSGLAECAHNRPFSHKETLAATYINAVG